MSTIKSDKVGSRRIYFYPHHHFRDRQLDTIRRWKATDVVNPELARRRRGVQVPEAQAVRGRIARSWKQVFPLVNVKPRPRSAPADAVIYVWGGLISTGQFILDLDNPYALVGYNPRAMKIWRPLIARILASRRCLQIRCLSEACRKGVRALFGPSVAAKSEVLYPNLSLEAIAGVEDVHRPSRLLFVGTQFVLKGGPELLEAFPSVRERIAGVTLDIITHLPEKYAYARSMEGVRVHDATFKREEIWSRFMRNCDVLVHPSYIESFGMVVLEALAHGLAVVANDVYAHREMVVPGMNGALLQPPVDYWSGVEAGPLFKSQFNALDIIESRDLSAYAQKLADAIVDVVGEPKQLLALRRGSRRLYAQRFSESARARGGLWPAI